MLFTTRGKIGYSSCDANVEIRLPEAIKIMQEIATDHLDSINLHYEELYTKYNMVFLLSKNSFIIHRMPKGGENYIVKTAPNHPKGARFIRDVIIYDEAENPLISFMSVWMLVDIPSRKILRPTAYPYEIPYKDSIVSGYLSDSRFPNVNNKSPSISKNIQVIYTHLDNNGHVNNSVYMGYALNMLDYNLLMEKGIDSGMIAYQNEARHGEIISVQRYDLAEGFYFLGKMGDIPCFEALIKLKP